MCREFISESFALISSGARTEDCVENKADPIFEEIWEDPDEGNIQEGVNARMNF